MKKTSASSVFKEKQLSLRNNNLQKQQRNVCKIHYTCGSCKYINSSYKKSLFVKYNKELQNFKELNLSNIELISTQPQASEKELSYRSTIKLAVRSDINGNIVVGLFKPGTHHITAVKHCPVHLEEVNDLLQILTILLNKNKKCLLPFDEKTITGDLRYIVIRCSFITNEIQLILVTRDDSKKNVIRKIVSEINSNKINITSVFINVNSYNTNRIFGDKFIKLRGKDHLLTKLNHVPLFVSPGSFLQVNPWVASSIYQRIKEITGETDRTKVAWDLYSGIGPITIHLAKLGFKVWSSEENESSTNDAIKNLQLNNIKADQTTVSVGKTEDCLREKLPSWAKKPSTIVVNPSRRGLDEVTCETIGEQIKNNKNFEHMIYVSCEARTLARDLKKILPYGGCIRQLESFDMFPQTEKLEWVAVVTKK